MEKGQYLRVNNEKLNELYHLVDLAIPFLRGHLQQWEPFMKEAKDLLARGDMNGVIVVQRTLGAMGTIGGNRKDDARFGLLRRKMFVLTLELAAS